MRSPDVLEMSLVTIDDSDTPVASCDVVFELDIIDPVEIGGLVEFK